MRAWRSAWIGLCWLLAACAAAPAGVVTLNEAELFVGDSAEPPGDDAAWTHVSLPDLWMVARRRQGLAGWYRLRVPAAAPTSESWALVAQVYPNAAFYLNGVEVGRGGRMEPPLSRNSFRPLYFALPNGAWREGENWLQVRFAVTPGMVGRLAPVRLGPSSALLPVFERVRLFESQIPSLSVALCVVLAAALLITASSATPGQRELAGALGCIALASVSVVAPDAPLPNRLVEWWVGSVLHWSVLLFALGSGRRWGRNPRGVRYWIAGWCAATVIYGIVPPYSASGVFVLWGVVTVPLFLIASVRLIRDGWRGGSRSSIAAGLVALGVMGSALLDRLSTVGDYWAELSALISLLFLLGFAGYLLVTLLHAVRAAESLNRTLDARVAAREAELERSYEQQRAAERARALAEERTRLMRDMHDGTGGRLVSALSLLRGGGATPGALEEALVEAIDDLHLTIDSLRPGAMDLPSVLGLLRARLERQVRQHSMRLEWAIGDAGDGDDLSPDQVLHVIRIVQEAVANALRHAGGTSVRVATGCDGDTIWFEIADDGRGGAKPRAGGRGLGNLEQRATMLGGLLELESHAAGTRVRVRLSAPVAEDAASLRGGLDPSQQC